MEYVDGFGKLWIIFLEIGVALGLAIFIVWWTLPKKPRRKEKDHE